MTVGSLFAGIGGFDLSFERAGFIVSWQVEKDTRAQAVLAKRFQTVKIYDDVLTVSRGNTMPVDVICGGFPCQDVSVAGKRKGLKGERTGLFFQVTRIADELKPKWMVLENVPGLLSSHEGRDFYTVLSELAECGFRRAYRILDQSNRSHAKGGPVGLNIQREVMYSLRAGRPGSIAATLNSGGNSGGFRTEPGEHLVCASSGERARALMSSMHKRHDGDTDTLIAWQESQSGVRAASSHPTLDAHNGSRRHQGALTTSGVRRLTPLECERLQGFPDGWTCLCGEGHRGSRFCRCGDSHRYKQLGNAVTVNVAEWIARRIAAIEARLAENFRIG